MILAKIMLSLVSDKIITLLFLCLGNSENIKIMLLLKFSIVELYYVSFYNL